MDCEQISSDVDVWIAEEELPAQLRPIRRFDCIYPKDSEEREAYWDFMHWHFGKDWQLLNLIPEDNDSDCFYNPIIANEDSAFNTMDYQKKNDYSFNRYHYRLKKIYERIKELAIMHSSISNEEGRANIKQRYSDLLDDEFRIQRDSILTTIKRKHPLLDKGKTFEKISELNIRISKAYSIWNQYANWE